VNLNILYNNPLLRLAIILIMGIAAGRHINMPAAMADEGLSVTTISGITLMILLALTVMLRRFEKAASAMLICAVFTLGIFLIKSERNTYSVPYAQQIERFMEERRMELSDIYQLNGLQGDEYAIVAAMTLGEKERVSQELKEIYNTTGASHLFALSGLHLGIIFMLLQIMRPDWLIFHLKRTRRVAQAIFVLLLIFTIWAYVLLVGCHPSIMRAAIMLTTYALTKEISRHPENIAVLTFTAALLLTIYPEWLFDIGFQMSFMAMLSLTLIYIPLQDALFNKETVQPTEALPRVGLWLRNFLIRMCLLSTCAQIGVGPLILLYFGRFSTYFLLTNLFVPILTTSIIYLAVTTLILGTLASFTATAVTLTVILSHILQWLTTAITFLVKIFNAYLTWIYTLPYSSIGNIHINAAQTLIIYLITFATLMLLYHLHHGLRRRLGRIQ